MENVITLKSPSEMTEEERNAEIAFHRERMKLLNATPRSDWHREFERILREEARPFGEDVVIRAEEELGIDPPRIDYLILDDMKRLMRSKTIFKMFKQHNIVEYKNPDDSLNMQVISKIIGYANFYIALTKGCLRSEVSITIFRARKNKTLFKKMIKEGTLKTTSIPGIYHVKKLIDLPFQIVITNELQGEEYAAYRVLTDHATEKDVELVAQQMKSETDTEVKENKQKLLEFVEKKNPGIMRRVMGGDEDMSSILMEVLEPEIKERDKERDRNNLYIYVQQGDMMLENAARNAGVPVDQFLSDMESKGYKVSKMS